MINKGLHIGKLARLPNGEIGLIVGCDTAFNLIQPKPEDYPTGFKGIGTVWLGGDNYCSGKDILFKVLVEGRIVLEHSEGGITLLDG